MKEKIRRYRSLEILNDRTRNGSISSGKEATSHSELRKRDLARMHPQPLRRKIEQWVCVNSFHHAPVHMDSI